MWSHYIHCIQVIYVFKMYENIFIFQILPLKRPLKWESVVTFSSPASKSFCFPVVGGQTMELAIAQFWSSGIGSRESSLVDFEVWVCINI